MVATTGHWTLLTAKLLYYYVNVSLATEGPIYSILYKFPSKLNHFTRLLSIDIGYFCAFHFSD